MGTGGSLATLHFYYGLIEALGISIVIWISSQVSVSTASTQTGQEKNLLEHVAREIPSQLGKKYFSSLGDPLFGLCNRAMKLLFCT